MHSALPPAPFALSLRKGRRAAAGTHRRTPCGCCRSAPA